MKERLPTTKRNLYTFYDENTSAECKSCIDTGNYVCYSYDSMKG